MHIMQVNIFLMILNKRCYQLYGSGIFMELGLRDHYFFTQPYGFLALIKMCFRGKEGIRKLL